MGPFPLCEDNIPLPLPIYRIQREGACLPAEWPNGAVWELQPSAVGQAPSCRANCFLIFDLSHHSPDSITAPLPDGLLHSSHSVSQTQKFSEPATFMLTPDGSIK